MQLASPTDHAEALQPALLQASLFHGVRARVGMFHGPIDRVAPHAKSGRADYLGPPANRAARLMAAAQGGQVIMEEATAQAVVREWAARASTHPAAAAAAAAPAAAAAAAAASPAEGQHAVESKAGLPGLEPPAAWGVPDISGGEGGMAASPDGVALGIQEGGVAGAAAQPITSNLCVSSPGSAVAEGVAHPSSSLPACSDSGRDASQAQGWSFSHRRAMRRGSVGLHGHLLVLGQTPRIAGAAAVPSPQTEEPPHRGAVTAGCEAGAGAVAGAEDSRGMSCNASMATCATRLG